MSEDQKFVEFCRSTPMTTIKVTPEEYKHLCERIENPLPPNPALILALEKGRRLRASMKK